MRGLDFKYMNLKRAYEKLVEVAKRYDGTDEIIRDSLIQRFEFCYELCHKTLYEFLRYEGVHFDNTYPRTIFKKAFLHGLIKDEALFISLLEDRNSTSHVYDEELAEQIAYRICKKYVRAIGELVEKIGEEV